MLRTVLEFLAAWPVLSLGVGIAALLGGGHLFVEASVTLAKRLGVSTLVIGLTIVAFGTSAPELAFNVIAAVADNSDLSFGNVVGSNIANMALVLGLASLVTPLAVHSRVVWKEYPVVLGFSVLMLVMGPFVALQRPPGNDGFSRIEGAILLLGFVGFVIMMLRLARSDRSIKAALESEVEEFELEGSLKAPILLLVAGVVLLAGGGKMAEVGAVGVAEFLGVSQAVIGLTVMALATSLPEVVTSLIAAKKGHADLAVGNVVGSNLFNIQLVFGLTALIEPVRLPQHGMEDLAIMVGITFLLGVLIALGRRRIPALAGLLLLALYAGYLVFTMMRERI